MEKIYTMGIDVGGNYIKAALMNYSDLPAETSAQAGNPVLIDKQVEKIRKRNPTEVADELINYLLDKNNLKYEDIAYLASTGEGELVRRKKGHFYSMTTHAKGGLFFDPDVKTVVDMGALYVKAIKINEQGRVLDYKMTGQCASGSGQFIENISRYLGLAID